MKKQKFTNVLGRVRLEPLVFDESTEKTDSSKFISKSKAIAFGF